MVLEKGASVGPYEVVEELGAGGMGEVYKAVDTRLDRTVAIKVLPEHLAASPELRQRMEREARAISSLTHPNICALYDLGHHEGLDFLVMEYIDGETLADRLAKGPLPSEELLRVAVQIADALEKAHRSGVIHRDLKPGNIMLTREGAKLLDFGLAKADASLGGGDDLTISPTVSHPLTAAGTILGTYQYMAPEQLEGREADPRTDIFAFGAVLYEMATGRRAFQGATQASLIGSIMHEQPQPASSIQPMTPPALDRVIQTCLAKDPDDRLQTAHDVKLQLQWIAEGGSVAGVPAPVSARRRSRERIAWTAFAVASAAALAFAVAWLLRAPKPVHQTRFEIAIPADLEASGNPRISPDGRTVAFFATDASGATKIWLRPMDSLDMVPLNGTESSFDTRPFWSPDSRHIAFFADGKLKRISVHGGPSQTICDADGADGTWSDRGEILFDGGVSDPIRRVAAGGGVPEDVVKPDTQAKAASVAWPEFLPGGRRFLYMETTIEGENRLMLGTLDSEERRQILLVDSRVQYVKPGYLLYVRDETLVAHPFDADSGELIGDPRPIADRVEAVSTGHAPFTASQQGTLVFSSSSEAMSRLLWRDRSGVELGTLGEPGGYGAFSISPDGRRVVFARGDSQGENSDLWIHDLERGVSSRFTFDGAWDDGPAWSPDGRRIAFSSARVSPSGIYVKGASGAGEPEQLAGDPEASLFASQWSADGRYLTVVSLHPEAGWDSWALSLAGSGERIPVSTTPFVDSRASISPDGSWVAYQSNESGQHEIYVQEFPEPYGKYQVSTAGGSEPMWSRDGREIYFLDGAENLVSVEVSTRDGFTAGVPEILFGTRLRQVVQRNRYDVTADGERFLLISRLDSQANPSMTVVQNWQKTILD
jgi:Tol biopolymer transport system component/predicted Ser/Thr protein kinase